MHAVNGPSGYEVHPDQVMKLLEAAVVVPAESHLFVGMTVVLVHLYKMTQAVEQDLLHLCKLAQVTSRTVTSEKDCYGSC